MGNDLAEFLRAASWCWLLVGGAAFVLWALLDDRPCARRRCPRCWYDLRGTPSRRCSECGYRGTTEQRLRRTRRHWRTAWVGACLLASAGATPLAVSVGASWPKHVPTAALIAGLSVIGDARWQAGWREIALDELLGRIGVGAAPNNGLRDLTDRQWRRLLRRAMERVPAGTGPPSEDGPWARALAAGLGGGAVHRAGLLEEFMERYPAQIALTVPVRWPEQEPLPFEISAETPFARPRLEITGITADGGPLDWKRPADGDEGTRTPLPPPSPSAGRGVLRIPVGRADMELRFDVELAIPVEDPAGGSATSLSLGSRTVVVGFRRDPRLGPLVRLLSEPTRDEFLVRRFPLPEPKKVLLPRPRRTYTAAALPYELEIELEPSEIAALSLREANKRYAVLSRAIQQCRLDDETRERLWREWRRIRVRVGTLRKEKEREAANG